MKTDKANPQPSNRNPNHNKKPNQAKEYLKYSGLAFQMIVVILAGYWIGQKLDEWIQTSIPIFTILSILVAIIGSIVLLIINALNSK